MIAELYYKLSKKYDVSALLLVIGLNWLVFVPVILYLPDFISDDYLIFSLIKDNPWCPISLKIKEEFFLFFRPLTYFTMWFDYTLWRTSPMPMKFTALVFHSGYVICLYFLFRKIIQYFNLKIHRAVLIIVMLFVTLHADAFIWIYWICNVNELLTVLFYSWAILCLLMYWEKRNNKYLAFSFCLYVISILAKQQSLHFPILAAVIPLLFKDRFPDRNKPIYKYFIIAGLLILFSVSAFTYLVNLNTQPLSEYIWKKPFAMAGTILYVISPLGGAELYNYYLLHKSAAFASLIILLPLFVIAIRHFKVKAVNLLKVLIIAIIIFYPRVAASGGERVNSIVIFWAGIAMLFLFSQIRKRQIAVITVCTLILISIASGYASTYEVRVSKEREEIALRELHQIIGGHEEDFFFPFRNIYPLEYRYPFFVNKDFGKVNFAYTGIALQGNLNKDTDGILYAEVKEGPGIVSMEIKNPSKFFVMPEKEDRNFTVLKSSPSANGRGYGYLQIRVPEKYKNKKIIYFDGRKWRGIGNCKFQIANCKLQISN